MRWTRKTIVAEIKRLHHEGHELNYASAESEHLNLVRAAAWHFGAWRNAVESAGIAYDGVSKYKRWGRERVVGRIRELHREGVDLSWRAVSTEIDPPLAAAALRPNGFHSWREAIAAAGLDINEVARYQFWDEKRVLERIKALHRARHALSSKAIQVADQSLFCAARRRFGSWDEALAQAGLRVEDIRLRQAPSIAPRAAKTNALQTTKSRGATTTRATQIDATKAPPTKTREAKTRDAKPVAAVSRNATNATKPASKAARSGTPKPASTPKRAETHDSSTRKARIVKSAGALKPASAAKTARVAPRTKISRNR